MSHSDRRAFISTTLAALVLPVTGFAAAPTSGLRGLLGPKFGPGRLSKRPRPWPFPSIDLTSALLRWNRIAIDASGLDHTPPAADEQRIYGEQVGPGRASRAMAIVHLAIYDATNAIAGQNRLHASVRGAAAQAAVAQAAHDTLVNLFPSQAPAIATLLADDLQGLSNASALRLGVELGRRSALKILETREGDGSEIAEARVGVDYFTSDDAGHWRQDPISQSPVALGCHWGEVRPFVLRNGKQFRVPPPPSMESAEYALAYAEALRLGGDGTTTPTVRTADQTTTGIYWAYDGTPSLCAPPRLYNQITTTIAADRRTEGVALARLLALTNTSMADAGIACWESKYYYDFWRPVTGIREADVGMGPTGAGDGNADTIADPEYVPLCAPASNLAGPNFTPPFPAYPSGHATFGGALFQTLRRFYGTDNIAFSFVSDEYNGVTTDHSGTVRPMITRTFPNLSAAEEENGQSRIYLGIHWAFDKTAGIAQGRRIANYVYNNALQGLTART